MLKLRQKLPKLRLFCFGRHGMEFPHHQFCYGVSRQCFILGLETNSG